MPPPWAENSGLLQKHWMDKKEVNTTSSSLKTVVPKTTLLKKPDDKKRIVSSATTEPQIAYPMGDFRTNDRGKQRKMDILMGTSIPNVKKNEILNDDIGPASAPLHEKEIWENERLVLLNKGKENAQISKKLDGSAWVDEDGYPTT
jgi:hypothetical protein